MVEVKDLPIVYAPRSFKKCSITPRQQAFIDDYFATGMANAYASAVRVGYSKRCATQTLTRFMKKQWVKDAIAERKAQLAQQARLRREDLLRELEKVIMANAKDFATWTKHDLEFTPSKDLSTDKAAAIAELSKTVSPAATTLKQKYYDKLTAIRLYAQITGMITNKNEVSGPDGKPLQMGLSKDAAEQLRIGFLGVGADGVASDVGNAGAVGDVGDVGGDSEVATVVDDDADEDE